MSKSVRVDGIHPKSSKFLYTAVLHANVPESSMSSKGEFGAFSTYSKRLMREHLARASMQEVESSEPHTPSPESNARVARLTDKVRKAYSEAGGNPADGRWAVVSNLLQLHSTRGGRNWIGIDLDARAPEIPGHLCQIPQTSEEWQEVERRFQGAEDVKRKVQRWIATAEFAPLTPDATVIPEQTLTNRPSPPPDFPHVEETTKGVDAAKSTAQPTLKAVSRASNPFASGSKFGFSVVKRTGGVVKDKPTPKGTPPQPLHSPAPVPERQTPPTAHQGDLGSPRCSFTSSNQPQQSILVLDDIGDAFDNNFNSPSFRVSQIHTSTPLPDSADHPRERGLLRSLNNLLPTNQSSPTTTHIHQPQRLSPSPTSHDPEPPHFQDVGISLRKREGSQSLEVPLTTKKPRTVVEDSDQLPQNPISKLDTADGRVTTRLDLPRPTDLVVSSTHYAPNTPNIQNEPERGSPHGLRTSNELSETEDHSLSLAARAKTKVTDSTAMLNINGASTHSGASDSYDESRTKDPNFDKMSQPSSRSHAQSSNLAPTSNAFETKILADLPTENAPLEDSLSAQQGLKLPIQFESAPDADASIEEALMVQESRSHTPTPTSPKDNPFRFPSIDSEPLSSPRLEATTYSLYGLDDLDSSPAKSLSSLAGSDSGSDGDDDQMASGVSVAKHLFAEFNPQFTSTQKPGSNHALAFQFPLASDSQRWSNEKLPSTSQLQAEVNSQVDEFDRFMEVDLGYDVVPGQ